MDEIAQMDPGTQHRAIKKKQAYDPSCIENHVHLERYSFLNAHARLVPSGLIQGTVK